MYRILTSIFILFSFFVNSQTNVTLNGGYLGQIPRQTSNININLGVSNSQIKRGPIMLLTGASLVITGCFMSPETYTTPSGFKTEKPFLRQGLRTFMVIGGSVLTSVGVVYTIKDQKTK